LLLLTSGREVNGVEVVAGDSQGDKGEDVPENEDDLVEDVESGLCIGDREDEVEGVDLGDENSAESCDIGEYLEGEEKETVREAFAVRFGESLPSSQRYYLL
jgi:hypothetical protein